MNFENWFGSSHPNIFVASVEAVLRLSAEGATLPFMARYRKEQTGNLDEVAIQSILDAKERWDQVLKRQAFILKEIESQKKLTPQLKEKILAAFDSDVLEDLYLPYKKKKKTKATLAKESGIGPLAEWIWSCGHGTEKPLPGQTLDIWALTFRNDKKGFSDVTSVLAGACDILVDRISEIQELRQLVRTTTSAKGYVKSTKVSKSKPSSKFERYFEYHELISSLMLAQNSHRYLAIRRGWMEEELTLSMGGAPDDSAFEESLLKAFESQACTVRDSPGAELLLRSARLAFKAHVFPSIESEIHRGLKNVADQAAIAVFDENVRKLLLASPFGPKAVLGIDPGIRTGCKLALVDDSGKYIGNAVLHLQSDEDTVNSAKLLVEIVKTGAIQAIAVGNGTYGRETESFVRATLKTVGSDIPTVMVSEAGASVYSASEVAREEFPELDVTVRGAISIARRLQDPLAELVKIDPKSIGVGQYQHDIAPASLKKNLGLVVDSCVNTVGVNLNTASQHLLSHVSGIGLALAKAIVAYREKEGLFKSRAALMEVPRFSAKAFEQAGGFLRIADGENALDNTGVHPERYPMLESLAQRLKLRVKDLMGPGVEVVRKDRQFATDVGAFTFEDIIRELEKPGRDPRELFVAFQYRDDIHELKDLKIGMMCTGIVTNVTNFGAFVDIGVHQDGLVHISQLSDRFVKGPREVVSPGDQVKVRVLEINLEKSQIALSMKSDPEVKRQQQEEKQGQRSLESRHNEGQRKERLSCHSSSPKFANRPFAVLEVLKKNLSKKP